MKKVDGKVWPAFVLYVGGCDYQGKETMGQQLGTIEETKIPEFLVTLGRHVAESGMEFHEWRQKNPDMLENLGKALSGIGFVRVVSLIGRNSSYFERVPAAPAYSAADPSFHFWYQADNAPEWEGGSER